MNVTPATDVAAVIHRGRDACPQWSDVGYAERSRMLKRAQQSLLDRKEEFARMITLEMGKPYTESLALELEAAIDLMGYYAKKAGRFLKDRRVSLHNILLMRRESYIHIQPLGVLGVIAPWNWPILLPMGCIAPALLAGNAVVFKHSEFTPLIAQKLRDLFVEAGVPEAVFQVIQGGADTGRALVDSDVEKIFFIGSTGVGRQIMIQAAPELKKSVLELGGSDPAIVCNDVDLEYASSGVVWGGFNTCGQNCISIERVFVHKDIAEEFIDRVIEKIRLIRVGNGMDEDSDMGPLVSQGQVEKMEAIVEMAVEEGAEVLVGGHRIGGVGYYFEPTLIRWDKCIDMVSDLEIFGPIMFITIVTDDDEAIRLANQSDYGLGATIWTGNPERGRQIAHRLEAGSVMINDVMTSFGIPEAERSGVKQSGVGWVHGEKGLDEMVNIQYINRDPQHHIQKLWWYPYSGAVAETIKAGLDFLFSSSVWKRIRVVPRVLRSFWPYLLLNKRRREKL